MNLRLDFELLLRRHGWRVPAVAAAVLALGAVAAFAARSRLSPPPTVEATDGNRQLEQRHRAFRNVLIPRQELDVRQRDVIDAALRHGLTLGRIDYGYEGNAAGRFGVATLQLPVRGAYADFRAFLAAVLAAQPAVALDDLAIERAGSGGGRNDGNGTNGGNGGNGGTGGIEARLRLAFHTEARPEAVEGRP